MLASSPRSESGQCSAVLIDGSLAASSLNTLLLSLGQLLDVAVHRVLVTWKLVAEVIGRGKAFVMGELTYEDDSNLGRHGEWIWTGEWKKEVERGEYKEGWRDNGRSRRAGEGSLSIPRTIALWTSTPPATRGLLGSLLGQLLFVTV